VNNISVNRSACTPEAGETPAVCGKKSRQQTKKSTGRRRKFLVLLGAVLRESGYGAHGEHGSYTVPDRLLWDENRPLMRRTPQGSLAHKPTIW